MKTKVKSRVFALILSILAVITMLPISAMTAGAATAAEITKKRNELVNYFHSMATVKWTAGQNFTVTAGGTQTYYKGQVYYGLPYASMPGKAAVTLESFNSKINSNSGKLNEAFGQSDCSTTLGVAYKKVLGVSQMWSVSCYSSSSYGFSKVSDYANLQPGDVLVKGSSHVMMVVSVNKSSKTVTVTHQSSAYFKYNPSSDTTGNTTYAMKTRNCSWGVNQSKSFDTLKSGGYTGYVHKDLVAGSSSTTSFTFNSVSVDSITETNANIYATFDLQQIDSAGFYFGTSSSSLKKISKSLEGKVDGAGKFNKINYPLNKWYGNLKANTTYYYKLYVVKDGKEYQTAVKSFNTKTSVLTIKYNANGGTIKSDRFKLVSNMVYDGSKLLESKWEYNKSNPYGLWNAESFGLYRTGYTFVGWGTTSSGGKVFDEDDASVKPSDLSSNIQNGSCTITLYAIWQAETVKKAPKLDKESVSIRYKSGDTISVTNGVKVTWASTNPGVAIVDGNGNVTAKKKGNATIIATSADGSKAECQVNVYMEWWQTLLKIISFGIY